MSNDQEQRGQWVPAIRIEASATPKQRARNYAFYERIRDGVLGSHREGGLKQFVFEVPVTACTTGGVPPHFTFRLDPASDCYRRLCSYIVGHTDSKCDADDEVERLRESLGLACKMISSALGRGPGFELDWAQVAEWAKQAEVSP